MSIHDVFGVRVYREGTAGYEQILCRLKRVEGRPSALTLIALANALPAYPSVDGWSRFWRWFGQWCNEADQHFCQSEIEDRPIESSLFINLQTRKLTGFDRVHAFAHFLSCYLATTDWRKLIVGASNQLQERVITDKAGHIVLIYVAEFVQPDFKDLVGQLWKDFNIRLDQAMIKPDPRKSRRLGRNRPTLPEPSHDHRSMLSVSRR